MFCIKNPSSLCTPWVLSKPGANPPVYIPLQATNLLKNYQIMGIEFLYHNYRRGFQGSILNAEHDMNFALQIAAFYSAVCTEQHSVLIVCPEQAAPFWNYHLTQHADFKVSYIGEQSRVSNERSAIILTTNTIQKFKQIEDIDFFSVVIDQLDLIAHKLIVKKMKGLYNIGLTHRSFYTHPDQKLQWQMLNWANFGSVGKLNDFYSIDNRNFANRSDNYHFWWLRLTWNFCESFEKPTEQELKRSEGAFKSWLKQNKSKTFSIDSNSSEATVHIDSDSSEVTVNSVIIDSGSSSDAAVTKGTKKRKFIDSDSSSDTIVFDVPQGAYPSMDESPILTSIVRNLNVSGGDWEQGRDKVMECSSKSESESFIIDLVTNRGASRDGGGCDVERLLQEADALLQN